MKSEQFRTLIMQVASILCGEPNKALSREGELRFGKRGSLSVNVPKGVWHDHELGFGGGVLQLIERFTGLRGPERYRWLEEHGLKPRLRTKTGASRARVLATYDYRNADGTLSYQVQRRDPRGFVQCRPGRQVGDPPIYNLDGVEPLPYRLPEVTEAIAQGQLVVIVEGEKDCDSLAKIGIVSSCNSGGAKKWQACITRYFKDAFVVIVGDNDDVGRQHVEHVAASMADVAASVRVLDLVEHWPGCPPKGDISDWLAAGGTREDLDALLEKATPWQAATARSRRWTAETHQSHQTHPHGTREIRLCPGERSRALAEALMLVRDRADLFDRGGELVWMTSDGFEPVSEDWLLGYFDANVKFVRVRSDGQEATADAPAWLARRLLAQKRDWGVPKLLAVISAPTMRADGTLLVEPGHDPATGLFLRRCPERIVVPESPTLDELRAAADRLWHPFGRFPFVDPIARSVMLASLLTAVVRQTLPTAPAFAFDAPSAGTGKTLLASCLLALCGMRGQVIPECQGDEEMRKRLLAALRAGQPCVLLDNIQGQFGSTALEAMLTAEVYSDRLLGGSTMLTVPTNTLVLIAGNNFRPTGDLWRRLLTSRIDAGEEAPERRSFDIDPLHHCTLHRHAMVGAALTLLRGFAAAGSPRTTSDRLASFRSWDDRIRQAVIWIGELQLMPAEAPVADPGAEVQRAKERDPERERLSAILYAIWAAKAGRPWRVAELINGSTQPDREEAMAGGGGEAPGGLLCELLEDIAGEQGGINSRKLGRWIMRHADRPCAGMSIKRAGQRSNTAQWRIDGEPSRGARSVGLVV